MEVKTVRIGKWDIPTKMVEDYVKARIMGDSYLMGKGEVPSGTQYERGQRWQLCVMQQIKIHGEICGALGIPYSEEYTDEFYRVFMDYVNKQVKLKG